MCIHTSTIGIPFYSIAVIPYAQAAKRQRDEALRKEREAEQLKEVTSTPQINARSRVLAKKLQEAAKAKARAEQEQERKQNQGRGRGRKKSKQ